MKKLKVLRFTMRHALTEVESEVNQTVQDLELMGQKVINITSYVVQTTPIYVIYNIVYEDKSNEDKSK